jgi:Zn-dependent M28 family amino/carboxypeptidase
MFLSRTLLVIVLSAAATAASFSGASALNYTRQAVAFGPRPPGSEANRKLQAYILSQVKLDGCEVIEDAFVAKTPKGDIPMKNIIARFPGKSGRAIAVTGHFDTKTFPGRKFVGANDGGSSTGLLLELAHTLAKQPRVDDVYIVFFDGEEAVGEWSDTDSVYGSKHLAERWHKEGFLPKIKALINVDMIGDKSLDIKPEGNSDPRLRRLVWNAAKDLGYQAYFLNESISPTEDDHLPFLRQGVPALDIIDFNYPPWHTDDDTMDKLSAQSLEIVGTVLLEAIHRLEQQ